MTPKRHVLLFSLLMGLLGCLFVQLPWTGVLEENWGLHLLFRLRGERSAPRQVTVIAIDRESADRLNLPLEPVKWPRSLHAKLVDRLKRLGAKVIAFDMLFGDPQNPIDDQRFAKAMHAAGNVVLAQTLTRTEMAVTDQNGQPTGKVNLETVIEPCPPLAEAAAARGPFPLPAVPIKLSRYWTFKSEAGDQATLPVVVFQVFTKDVHDLLQSFSRAEPPDSDPFRQQAFFQNLRRLLQADPALLPRLKEKIAQIPPEAKDDATRHLLKAILALCAGPDSRYLDFYGPSGAITTVPYHRVLESSSRRQLDFRGKAVFIGQTESAWPKVPDGFYHVFADDRGIAISGVEVAATAFANLLEGRSVHALADWQQLLLAFFWGSCAALVGFLFPACLSWACLAVMAGAYLTVAHHYFFSVALWLPIVVPVYFLIPVAGIAGLTWNYRRASRERRNIRKAFGFYLPDEVVDQLAGDSQEVHHVGKVVYGICLMTDAARYSTVSETLAPDDLKSFMNEYYQAIFAPIRAHGGIILQVIGDSVLAFWTAREPAVSLKTQACNAALGVISAVDRFNQDQGHLSLPTRIGMNAGRIALGNIGAMDHFEYRPVGDMVNTASRLEGLNKYLGTRMLLTEDLATGLGEFFTRSVGRFLFAGKTNSTRVVELLPHGWMDEVSRRDIGEAFRRGLTAFGQRDWQTAVQAFQAVLALAPGDGPSRFYLEQCDRYRLMKLEATWDGTVSLEHK